MLIDGLVKKKIVELKIKKYFKKKLYFTYFFNKYTFIKADRLKKLTLPSKTIIN